MFESSRSNDKNAAHMGSGLIYETRPANPFAAVIQERVQAAFDDLKAKMAEQTGMKTLLDVEILVCWCFGESRCPTRQPSLKGRAFLDF